MLFCTIAGIIMSWCLLSSSLSFTCFVSCVFPQMQILDKFPIEGGQKDPKKRIIPFLPGDFGRNLSSPFLSSAHTQIHRPANTWCQQICHNKSWLCWDRVVLLFLTYTHTHTHMLETGTRVIEMSSTDPWEQEPSIRRKRGERDGDTERSRHVFLADVAVLFPGNVLSSSSPSDALCLFSHPSVWTHKLRWSLAPLYYLLECNVIGWITIILSGL